MPSRAYMPYICTCIHTRICNYLWDTQKEYLEYLYWPISISPAILKQWASERHLVDHTGKSSLLKNNWITRRPFYRTYYPSPLHDYITPKYKQSKVIKCIITRLTNDLIHPNFFGWLLSVKGKKKKTHCFHCVFYTVLYGRFWFGGTNKDNTLHSVCNAFTAFLHSIISIYFICS